MRKTSRGRGIEGGRSAEATVGTDGDADRMAPRGSLALLRDPVFGPFWIGKVVATLGIWVNHIVAAILTYQLTRSTLMVGVVSMAQFLPQIFLAPLSGAQADRGDPKRQLVVGRLVAAAGSGLLVVAIGTLGLDGMAGAWTIVAATGIVGIGFAVGGPAMHSLLPTLVEENEVPAAVALSSLTPLIARAGGPVLGAFVLGMAGPGVAFAVAGITNLVFAAIIAGLPIGQQDEHRARTEGRVRDGLTYLRSDPRVAFLLLGLLALGFGADPVLTLTPALSNEFGRGEDLVGILATAFGVGAALMFPFLRPLRTRCGLSGMGTLGLVFMVGGLAMTGIGTTPPAAMAGLALAGAGFSSSVNGLTSRIYELVPGSYRGRIMALWSVVFIGSRPVAAGINGAIADATSAAIAFVVAAVLVAVLAALSVVGGRRALSSAGPA